MRAKVNLIPYNPGSELPYRPSPLERVLAFQQLLTERNIPAYIRISRGQDVGAACGQLRLEGMQEREPGEPGVCHYERSEESRSVLGRGVEG
jgi:23S rRNA (adenine2503-C2)-methyltransferase